MKASLPVAATALVAAALMSAPTRAAGPVAPTRWVGSWSASPQPVWGQEFLFPTNVPARLEAQTVRQVARLSLGGPRIRVVLSNAYGRQPLGIGRATVALSAADGATVPGSVRTLTFAGQP